MIDHVMVTVGRPYYGHVAAWGQPQLFSEELRQHSSRSLESKRRGYFTGYSKG